MHFLISELFVKPLGHEKCGSKSTEATVCGLVRSMGSREALAAISSRLYPRAGRWGELRSIAVEDKFDHESGGL
ncbi:MAG: hypothetical protein CL917_12045 [Deltaproteobacteria bacterium]|nr:hypothetical protein [Deltaproteobacteria bacterium]